MGVSPEKSEVGSSSNQVPEVEIKLENEEDPKETKEEDQDIWKGKPTEGVEKSRDEEFEEYLADLFL